jgi:hypothetical protein
MRQVWNVLIRKMKERYHFRDRNVDERIILKWILKAQCLRGCTVNSRFSPQGPMAGAFEQGGELSWKFCHFQGK